MTASAKKALGLEVLTPLEPGFAEILTADALRFLTTLARACEPRRQELLARRVERQRRLAAGELPDFLPETRAVREADWTVAPIPADLADRRVEITGPVDRKMIINALNSGARVYMADFEDSNAPTWRNNVEGQLNLRDAVRGTIAFTSPEGKVRRDVDRADRVDCSRLCDQPAVGSADVGDLPAGRNVESAA